MIGQEFTPISIRDERSTWEIPPENWRDHGSIKGTARRGNKRTQGIGNRFSSAASHGDREILTGSRQNLQTDMQRIGDYR